MNEIIERIVALLTANVKTPRGIKQIYKGDPLMIPQNSLPAIAVSPVESTVETVDSENDQSNFVVSINLIINAKDYFNRQKDDEAGLFIAAKIMEEKESSSNKMREDTILKTIRKSLYADSVYSLKTGSEAIDYGYRNRDYPTIEAFLTITVNSILYSRE